jgi:deoxyribodipyrimidine photolyase-related protein
MSAVSLVFPHHLFKNNPALKTGQPVFIVEEPLFFTQYKFHKQKLVFHRASMKAYCSYLQQQGYVVTYIEAQQKNSDIRNLLPYLRTQQITEIHYTDVTDCWLQQRLAVQAKKLSLNIVTYHSPLFVLTPEQSDSYFKNKKRFYQTDFYTHQRKQFKILVDEKLQPLGGKWTFDAENRLKYPKGKTPPEIHFPNATEFWREAKHYVEKNFPTHYGEVSDTFIYPTTFTESRAWLTQFLNIRFAEFGDFEDALVNTENILHHSVLTPMMNVGLLTPAEVLDEAITAGTANNIPLNSVEGFVRQILGWREFIRGVYETKGVTQRTTHYWKFTRKIPPSFWNASTGIAPVDDTIKKVLATGYCHHIERLMVLGNFMLLCEFDPDEVYKWFMELFIDSYDWVMVPNVYGMSQFADGGLMATKPYISGSNYLMKMSDYKKGDWQLIWDGLFWRFMHTHREFFLQNPRLGMLVKTFDKMPQEKQHKHVQIATDYLKTLDTAIK